MSKVLLRIGSVIPKFSQCIINLLDKNANSVDVELSLSDGYLTLSRGAFGSDLSFQLQHSNECPIQQLEGSASSSSETDNTTQLPIPVAVSVVLESCDNHVLLTRRAGHLRSSPGVWVPPGGHLEKGESLLECGLRELHEETGLDLQPSEFTANILCLWENVYPIMLGFGNPRSHVLVVYYHVRSQCTSEELRLQMKINPEEVEAYVWIPPFIIAELFKPCKAESYPLKQYIAVDGNKIVEEDMKYLNMFNRYVWTSGKVYSGVQCSLLKWYENYSAMHLNSKL